MGKIKRHKKNKKSKIHYVAGPDVALCKLRLTFDTATILYERVTCRRCLRIMNCGTE